MAVGDAEAVGSALDSGAEEALGLTLGELLDLGEALGFLVEPPPAAEVEVGVAVDVDAGVGVGVAATEIVY